MATLDTKTSSLFATPADGVKDTKSNKTMIYIIRDDEQGFWLSYHRTARGAYMELLKIALKDLASPTNRRTYPNWNAAVAIVGQPYNGTTNAAWSKFILEYMGMFNDSQLEDLAELFQYYYSVNTVELKD